MSMIPLIARKHITVLKVTDDYYFLSVFHLDWWQFLLHSGFMKL